MPTEFLTICGPPPEPAALWRRWTLDAALLAALFAAGGAGVLLARSPRRKALFAAGWTTLALSLVSPLCALAVALFSARIAQHLLIALVAAPLIAAAFAPRRAVSAAATPLTASLLFAAAMWIWHAPAPYAAATTYPAAYWAMHGSVLCASVLLWRALFTARGAGALGAAAAGFVTTAQMALLGALFVFADAPAFAPHFETTHAFGLSPLDDQRLAGMLMWGPACAGLLIAALAPLARLLAADAAPVEDASPAP